MRLVSVLLLCVSVAFAVGEVLCDEAAAKEKLKRILEKAEKAPLQKIWSLESDLQKLEEEEGDDAVDAMVEARSKVSDKVRVLLDKALITLGMHHTGVKDLAEVALDEGKKREVRMAAVALLMQHASKRQARKIQEKFKKVEDPFVRIRLLRFFFHKLKEIDALRELRKQLNSQDPDIQAEAAIALAQEDEFETTKEILERIREEPTSRGALVRSLLAQNMLMRELARYEGLKHDALLKAREAEIERLRKQVEELKRKLVEQQGTKVRLLDELLWRIKQVYVDEKKTDQEKLIEAAAKGMVSSLDPYSTYFDENETKLMEESTRQQYSGIGAVVTKKPGDYLTIQTPFYDGPAYRAGLRSGDKIVEVEGKDTRELTINECVKLLKGKEGTKVRIKVWRRTWPKEKEFVLTRAVIKTRSVYYRLLPGGIGYILLTAFNKPTAKELDKALDELARNGAKALILDLRNNPGGLLRTAIEVTSRFLPTDSLIVTSKGRNPRVAPEEKYTAIACRKFDQPLVVLINGGSASASEIVSGALKHYKRATLVGERTYGKGSVQQMYRVLATGGRTLVKLTVAHYYLPDGRCIDRMLYKKEEWGVAPDVEAKLPEWPLEWWNERERLLEQDVFAKYFDTRFNRYKEKFIQLAKTDNGDWHNYPEFEEWYRTLNTKMPKDLVRRMLRAELLRRVSDETAHRIVGDFVDDAQLRRAIIEALKKTGKKPEDVPEYNFFTK